jgi:hypothetical protein
MKPKVGVQRRFLLPTIFLVMLIVISGCGTTHHNIAMQNDYLPKAASKVEVRKVSNNTGEKFDVDVEQMLATALERRLRDEQLLYASNTGPKLSMNCKILTYEKGNAFKRWLMPGWGATTLSVQCDLLDTNKVIGSLNAMRSVSAGGGYTINEWEKVFADVAKHIAQDIKSKVK